MSAKKARGRARVLKVPQAGDQQASTYDLAESPNLSAIDKASFLEGLQPKHGNPMHSTAVEEDLNVHEEGQTDKGNAERRANPGLLKGTVERGGAAAKMKKKENNEKNVKGKERNIGEKGKARADKGGGKNKKRGEEPKSNSVGHLVDKKPAIRKGAAKTTAARPLKNTRMKKDKTSDSASLEDSDPSPDQQGRRNTLLSSDEEGSINTSWNPSPKKAKMNSLLRDRKSSSDGSKSRKSSSGGESAERMDTDKQRRRGAGTELETVLDAFLDFCDQSRESVESKAVKQSLDTFSSNVKEQLLEKITSNKEFRALKRENTKVGSLIRTNTQRLFDAKNELMRAKRQMSTLKKETSELTLRLADLRRSQAFLLHIRELSQQLPLPEEGDEEDEEEYGAPSLPALLLELKHIRTAENQLREINDRLEKRLRESETCEK